MLKPFPGYKFYQYLSILNIVIWSKQRGSGKDFNSNMKDSGNGVTHPNAAQLSQAGDQQGYCGINVDAMDLVATIAYDKDFLDETRYMNIAGFTISGQVILNGEVGIKVGWGNMGDPNVSGDHADEARCKSGEIVFAIPYAQASLSGELALDLALARGGGGVNVLLVKFSLPATTEKMEDAKCGGVYFKAESLGGKVYGFIDVLKSFRIKVGGGCWYCFWRWEIKREWSRKMQITFYEWSSPAVWTSNEIKCDGPAAASSGISIDGLSAVHPRNAIGKAIAFLGGRGEQYCADEGNTVKCNRNQAQSWEKFTVVDAGDGKIGLKGGKDGRYCADELNYIQCNRNWLGAHEKFTVVDAGDGKIGLKGGHHHRYCADDEGGVKCNRDGIGQWEKFTSLEYKPRVDGRRVFGAAELKGNAIGLKGGNFNRYCADEDNRVVCNRGRLQGWEKFTVVDAGDGKIGLKGGKGGRYCADELNYIQCNRNWLGTHEKFTVVDAGDGKVALKGGHHHRYCADDEGGVKCNRDGIGQWEKFFALQA